MGGGSLPRNGAPAGGTGGTGGGGATGDAGGNAPPCAAEPAFDVSEATPEWVGLGVSETVPECPGLNASDAATESGRGFMPAGSCRVRLAPAAGGLDEDTAEAVSEADVAPADDATGVVGRGVPPGVARPGVNSAPAELEAEAPTGASSEPGLGAAGSGTRVLSVIARLYSVVTATVHSNGNKCFKYRVVVGQADFSGCRCRPTGRRRTGAPGVQQA